LPPEGEMHRALSKGRRESYRERKQEVGKEEGGGGS
jgi:hypothetical protein